MFRHFSTKNKLKVWKKQLVWLMITTLHIKFLLLLNQNLLPHIPKINLCLVIHLACPVNPIDSKPNSTSETKNQYPLSRPTCNYCKKPGHLVSECLKLKRKLERDEAKPTGLTTFRPRPQSSIKSNTIDIVTKPKSDSTMEIF